MKIFKLAQGTLLCGFIFIFGTYTISAQILEEVETLHKYQKLKDFNKEDQKKIDLQKFVKTNQKTGRLKIPSGVNPFLSNSPNAGNYKEWSEFVKEMNSRYYEKNDQKKSSPLLYEEQERDFENTNDIPSRAEVIPNFGSKPDQNGTILVRGFANASINSVPSVSLGDILEEESSDNGTVFSATPLEFTEDFQTLMGTAVIGDGSDSSSGTQLGDFDVYSIALLAGQTVNFKVLSNDPNNPINPAIITATQDLGFPISDGSVVVEGVDSVEINFTAPDANTYYFMIADFESFFDDVDDALVINVFDTDGRGGVGLEGGYTFEVTLGGRLESDFYSVQLEKGDVFGLASNGSAIITEFYTPNGKIANGTISAPAFPIIEESPLPTNGELVFSYIAEETGTYTFRLIGTFEAYEAEIAVSRPGFETINKGKKQVIYLDYTGGIITPRPFIAIPPGIDPNIPGLDEELELSPFEDFMENWGIENTFFNRIRTTYEITNVVKENIERDLAASEINSDFDVIIISDYGNPVLGKKIPEILDKVGIPFSRVIVGGTIEESGFSTIGLASVIDTGNFSLDDDAFVLLDLLSLTDETDLAFENSINSIPLSENATRSDAVTVTLGNIISHEIGHFLGNFHTDNSNDINNIMDQGGRGISFAAGVVEGGAFGDENTVDVDFVQDNYSVLEGFTSLSRNLTDVNTAYALGFRSRFRTEENFDLPTNIEALENQVLAQLNSIASGEQAYSWPNPQSANETSKLIFSSKQAGHTVVTLYDMQGRKIKEIFNGFVSKGKKNEVTLTPSQYSLTSGIYFYEIKNSDRRITHKFLVK
ncbi:T9SS type A sorting domain-containing protein [Aquimarina sp. RZ0]|uniref:T9SS type A sorting domain-containing protein n=1 Tax=Aquimarina sp. RZ0 TaxID=2607730 RepID=UPI0011F29154|nr:T9SS type A sorting domain-containing protein [Aquimarina sp. RZ0]KAA1244267.1 T9SS type A sorting domain-containing protein [Aquimarina sp. RZ0]